MQNLKNFKSFMESIALMSAADRYQEQQKEAAEITAAYETMSSEDKASLATDIRSFLDAHARIAPSFDPEYDDCPYTSPDAAMMLSVAERLEQGVKPTRPWSSWMSGGYKGDKTAEQWHESLIARIYTIC